MSLTNTQVHCCSFDLTASSPPKKTYKQHCSVLDLMLSFSHQIKHRHKRQCPCPQVYSHEYLFISRYYSVGWSPEIIKKCVWGVGGGPDWREVRAAFRGMNEISRRTEKVQTQRHANRCSPTHEHDVCACVSPVVHSLHFLARLNN